MSEQLRRVTTDIERGTARLGWDKAPSLYALVQTELLLNEPNLPSDISEQISAEWDGTPAHLSAILQEQLPEDNLEEVLPRLAWPEGVTGAAVSVERVVVPPTVEDEAPEDPEAAAAFIADHPLRTDVRITVGALRDGQTWSMIRTRTFDSDEAVVTGEKLVPMLSELLVASLSPDQP